RPCSSSYWTSSAWKTTGAFLAVFWPSLCSPSWAKARPWAVTNASAAATNPAATRRMLRPAGENPAIAPVITLGLPNSAVFEVEQHRGAENQTDAGRRPGRQQYRNFGGKAQGKHNIGQKIQQEPGG